MPPTAATGTQRARPAKRSREGASALRIACWSGPRNISTAMMRAWENRADTAVSDEPLYAHYLAETGTEHPGRDEVIENGDCDWRRVVRTLTGPVPGGKPIWYQKHMTHHLLPEIARGWLAGMVNCFLIRDPSDVLLSYSRTREPDSAEEIGFPQQAEIFDAVCDETGSAPVVIDATDFLRDPEGQLRAWCGRLGIGFDERMLRWPAGRRDSDGVWAPHWYGAVERSTGFEPWRARDGALPPALRPLLDECLPHYLHLHAHRLVT